MSQELFPLNNGRSSVQTTVNTPRINVLSKEAIKARGLEPQLTQWRPEGRPIYRRLPSASENYQIDFFEEKGKGYVYIPYGEGIFGPTSMEVVASENNESIIIKPGTVVWEYGECPVNAVVIDCKLVGLLSTRYLIGYQLYYDDAPFEAQYGVKDYALTGYPLNISSSADSVVGWRYLAVNAFINDSDNFWSVKDKTFPTYAQPSSAWLSWETDRAMALSNITLRCPSDTVVSGNAKLYYKINDVWEWEIEAAVEKDDAGYFVSFNLNSPTFQKGFKVEWEDLNVAIQSVTVSGVITLTSRPATLTPQSALVAYPENMVPDTFVNSQGEEVPVSICALAYVDVDDNYTVTRVDDVRNIIHKDYKPIAEWLTRPQDEDLIQLFEGVSDYSNLWMSPRTALKFEYIELGEKFVEVNETEVQVH